MRTVTEHCYHRQDYEDDGDDEDDGYAGEDDGDGVLLTKHCYHHQDHLDKGMMMRRMSTIVLMCCWSPQTPLLSPITITCHHQYIIHIDLSFSATMLSNISLVSTRMKTKKRNETFRNLAEQSVFW